MEQKRSRSATEVQQKCGRSATEVPQKCNRSGTEVQQKWNRSATEVEQKCNRSATEAQQKCNRSGTEVQRKWNKRVNIGFGRAKLPLPRGRAWGRQNAFAGGSCHGFGPLQNYLPGGRGRGLSLIDVAAMKHPKFSMPNNPQRTKCKAPSYAFFSPHSTSPRKVVATGDSRALQSQRQSDVSQRMPERIKHEANLHQTYMQHAMHSHGGKSLKLVGTASTSI